MTLLKMTFLFQVISYPTTPEPNSFQQKQEYMQRFTALWFHYHPVFANQRRPIHLDLTRSNCLARSDTDRKFSILFIKSTLFARQLVHIYAHGWIGIGLWRPLVVALRVTNWTISNYILKDLVVLFNSFAFGLLFGEKRTPNLSYSF